MIIKAALTPSCKERRDIPLDLVDLKTFKATSDKPFTFEGYGSVWDRIDSYGDTVLKGAFTDSLKARIPMMFYGHDSRRVPGKWVSVKEDNKGLWMRGELTPGHSEAKDLEASLVHGSITGLSIGGYTIQAKWIEENDQMIGREIQKFDLYETSVVSMPAEGEARIDPASLKSALMGCKSLRAVEAYLREEHGFSRATAETLISRVKALTQGDPGDEHVAKELVRLTSAIRDFHIPQSLLES